eukprot:364329-Chlamydomonas_euryale.AAC.11
MGAHRWSNPRVLVVRTHRSTRSCPHRCSTHGLTSLDMLTLASRQVALRPRAHAGRKEGHTGRNGCPGGTHACAAACALCKVFARSTAWAMLVAECSLAAQHRRCSLQRAPSQRSTGDAHCEIPPSTAQRRSMVGVVLPCRPLCMLRYVQAAMQAPVHVATRPGSDAGPCACCDTSRQRCITDGAAGEDSAALLHAASYTHASPHAVHACPCLVDMCTSTAHPWSACAHPWSACAHPLHIHGRHVHIHQYFRRWHVQPLHTHAHMGMSILQPAPMRRHAHA